MRGTALPWSGNAPPGQGSSQLPAETGGAQPAVARVAAHPVAEAEEVQLGDRPGGQPVAAGLVPREDGRVGEDDVMPGPRRPGRGGGPGRAGSHDEDVGRCGDGAGWHAVQCPCRRNRGRPLSRRAGSAARRGPSSRRSSAVRRSRPVPRRAAVTSSQPAGSGPPSRPSRIRRTSASGSAGRPGPVQPQHQVEVVDGRLDGERGQQVGDRQGPPLGAHQVGGPHPAGGVEDGGRGLGVARRRSPSRPPWALAAIRVLHSSSSSPGSGGRHAVQ